MTTEPSWGDRAVQMAREGDSIENIRKAVEADWFEVWQYVKEAQGTQWSTWQGAKSVITRRINKMVTTNDRETREELKKEVAECVNYLYYEGKRLRGKIERARKSLEY